MHLSAVVLLFLTTGISIFIFNKMTQLQKVLTAYNLEETWWKQTKPIKPDTAIKPFIIDVPDVVLNDLEIKLNLTIPLQNSLPGSKQYYGVNNLLLGNFINLWINDYDWRKRERFLNQLPQFKTNIQGLDIHFIHFKPKRIQEVKKTIPLLMLHGWPGSVRQFYEIILMLSRNKKLDKIGIDIVAPSLPGFGFSEYPELQGLSTPQIAIILKNLMARLGYDKFYVYGTDWGGFISSQMSALYPEKILGMYSTICWLNTPMVYAKRIIHTVLPNFLVKREKESNNVHKEVYFFLEESGYLHIQATKPDTVGVALRDSPVGLAAYVLEKYSTWTNPEFRSIEDGGLNKTFLIKILDNVMIYWVTGSITTSMRLYKEYFNQAFLNLQIDSLPIEVPAACARFKNDLIRFSDSELRGRYKNLLQLNSFDEGGHFVELQLPEILAEDIAEFLNKVESVIIT